MVAPEMQGSPGREGTRMGARTSHPQARTSGQEVGRALLKTLQEAGSSGLALPTLALSAQVWLLFPDVLDQVPPRHVANILGRVSHLPLLPSAPSLFHVCPLPPPCILNLQSTAMSSCAQDGTSQPHLSPPTLGWQRPLFPLALGPGSGPLPQVGLAEIWAFGLRSALSGSVTCTV